MKAIRQLLEVDGNNSVIIKALPFKPGSKIEVIVLPAGETSGIFGFMDEVVKKRKISPLNLKQVEKIVHDARAGK